MRPLLALLALLAIAPIPGHAESTAPRGPYDPAVIDTWTLAEQVGQLIIWASTRTPADLAPVLQGDPAKGYEPIPIGGLLITSNKDRTLAETRTLAAFLRDTTLTPIPPFLCADQEGGKVAALRDGVRVTPSAMVLGGFPATQVRQLARDMGMDTHSAGIEVILGPVFDVDGDPLNPVIGGKERSFGSNPSVVAANGRAFALGLADAGLVPVLKHFPGHGSAIEDSHLLLPTVPLSLSAWERSEQVPYGEFFDSFVIQQRPIPMMGVMVAHLDWPALTNGEGPTCYSSTLVTKRLRERYGLQDSVIVSDDLLMKAIDDPVLGAVAMRRAGIDLLIVSRDPLVLRQVHRTLVKYYANGWLDREELRASLRRILRMKAYTRSQWKPLTEQSIPLLPEGVF